MNLRTRVARLWHRRRAPPSVLILIKEHGEISMGNKTLTWDEAMEAAKEPGVMIVRIVRDNSADHSQGHKD